MRKHVFVLTAVLACSPLVHGVRSLPSAQISPLHLIATIPLQNVRGRIDHFGIDVKGRRLFMSALGNNAVEVFDLRAYKRLHTIVGLRHPQGVTYAPDSNKIFVANADDGKVDIFDGSTYRLISVINFGSDADDTYDSTAHRVYVGYGEGGIGAIDTRTGKMLGAIKLPAHPEAFEVQQGGNRIYINIPEAREIAIADWTSRAIVASWRIGQYLENFPMALDVAGNRLFVVTRKPAQFLALDATSGDIIAHTDAVSDADDLWYDAAAKEIYISGGEGFVSVIEQHGPDRYRVLARIPTAPGARTSFFSPQLRQLYVAVPRHAAHEAELRVYQAPRPD